MSEKEPPQLGKVNLTAPKLGDGGISVPKIKLPGKGAPKEKSEIPTVTLKEAETEEAGSDAKVTNALQDFKNNDEVVHAAPTLKKLDPKAPIDVTKTSPMIKSTGLEEDSQPEVAKSGLELKPKIQPEEPSLPKPSESKPSGLELRPKLSVAAEQHEEKPKVEAQAEEEAVDAQPTIEPPSGGSGLRLAKREAPTSTDPLEDPVDAPDNSVDEDPEDFLKEEIAKELDAQQAPEETYEQEAKSFKVKIIILVLLLGLFGVLAGGGYFGYQYVKGSKNIHIVMLNDELDSLQDVLDFNPDSYNQLNTDGQAPIHLAADMKQNMLEPLILFIGENPQYDIDIRTKDKETGGQTALQIAVKKCDTDTVNKLLQGGASVTAKDNFDNMPLMSAVECDDLNLFKMLLKKADDINVKGKNEESVLHVAAREGNLEMVKLIIERGAEVDIGSVANDTPLQLATFYGHLSVAKYLISKGADVNHENKNKQTAIIIAVIQKKYELTKYLLEKGAKINVLDSHKKTALNYAYRTKNARMLKLLRDNGAKSGKTLMRNMEKKKSSGSK
ncbi:MAG: ankyrin repeat domain-containing protein [Lentisphaeria bacterium]|nr:ankyrin repeat domain-containing protein [Lentisphaeria bacterium]